MVQAAPGGQGRQPLSVPGARLPFAARLYYWAQCDIPEVWLCAGKNRTSNDELPPWWEGQWTRDASGHRVLKKETVGGQAGPAVCSRQREGQRRGCRQSGRR